jgi:acetoin utilization deacetylase AcuC-like enzyme
MTTAYITHPRFLEHDLHGHPEHAGRTRAIWQRMQDSGLLPELKSLTPDFVSEADILTVHNRAYLELLQSTVKLKHTAHLDADTYITPTSYEVARLSAGACTLAVDEVLRGESDNAMVVARPPGHHAEPETGMGFCLLNNIAIAARYAQKQYGIGRVMIVDYDVHHGNGTEAVFYDDPSVLFVSTHQSPLYPNTGKVNDIGRGKCEGSTLNIPMPSGCGDTAYAQVFEQVIAPAAQRYAPELILVSAGYDAHHQDPLAGMRLTLNGFADMGRHLMEMATALCGGKIVFVMEGGYNLDALSYGWVNVANILLGKPTDDPIGLPADSRPEPDLSALIAQVRQIHKL